MGVQAICVVSKAKGTARSGKLYRMQALAVKEETRGRGLAAEALRRLQVELVEMAGTDYRMVADMAACMAKEGVGFYARQGWAGRGGVWEWDSRTSPSRLSRGSRGKLQMEEEELQRKWKCKRQSSGEAGEAGWRRREGAGGEGRKRDWVEDEREEAEHRLGQEGSQVQQEEAAPEGAAGEPDGGEAPLEGGAGEPAG